MINWQPEQFYDGVIGPKRREEMFAAVDLHAINDKVDQGEDFHTTIEEAAKAYPEFHDEIMMWHDRWLEIATPDIPHSVRLLRALRAAGVPVFALSNFGIQTFELARPVYPFLDEFDQRYISGYLGKVKPWAPIYEALEEGCGITPSALLFADDRQENLDAATIRGWQTHLFVSPQDWAARLVQEGLLSPEAAE